MRPGIFLKIFALISIISCNPCRNLDCLQDNYQIRFRLLSRNDNSDLLFGGQNTYNPDQIRFYSIDGNDTLFHHFQLTAYSTDSIVEVQFLPGTNHAFMELDNGDKDTLILNYKTENTKCCGTITTIEKFIYNNNQEFIGDNIPKILKK